LRSRENVEFYLPKGKWTSFFTGDIRIGPGWFRENHGFGTLPLYVREKTILVLGNKKETGAVRNYVKDVEVALYETAPGTKTIVSDYYGNVLGELEVGGDGKLKEYVYS
jgi:alpha-D-xyloside xylohydrolase